MVDGNMELVQTEHLRWLCTHVVALPELPPPFRLVTPLIHHQSCCIAGAASFPDAAKRDLLSSSSSPTSTPAPLRSCFPSSFPSQILTEVQQWVACMAACGEGGVEEDREGGGGRPGVPGGASGSWVFTNHPWEYILYYNMKTPPKYSRSEYENTTRGNGEGEEEEEEGEADVAAGNGKVGEEEGEGAGWWWRPGAMEVLHGRSGRPWDGGRAGCLAKRKVEEAGSEGWRPRRW